MFLFTTRTFLTNQNFAVFAVSSTRVFFMPRTNGGKCGYINFPIWYNVMLTTIKWMTFCTAFTQYQQARFTILRGHAVAHTTTNQSLRHFNFLPKKNTPKKQQQQKQTKKPPIKSLKCLQYVFWIMKSTRLFFSMKIIIFQMN